jgi:DNA-binding FadR family transcriptional regulator
MTQPAKRLQRARVADQIVDDLRRQILSGELANGSRLPAERELAAQYGVSAPTVREAVRVLTAMGLLSTRNGSRSVVTASFDNSLSMSIASVVQFQKMTARDVFGLLTVLNGYAVELAVDRATEAEIATLRAAAQDAGEGPDDASASAALAHYYATIAEISHNPLLAGLCRIISSIQIGVAVELSRASGDTWGKIPRSMHADRLAIVDAIEARDAGRAVQLMQKYHTSLMQRIQASPGAAKLRKVDPGLTTMLSAWLGDNVGVGMPSTTEQ